MGRVYKYLKALKHVTVALFAITVIIAAIHFPYDVDTPLTPQEIEAARKYYTEAYQKPVTENQARSEYETECSGRGYLQDIAQDYTGLDISPAVARFYHKKFVLASATAMPFPDDSFDGVWSIWVFEHVPNPEQAFHEARRVTRDNGVLFLLPAWTCASWAAEGYEVRPYSDFDLVGKLIKASIPLRSSVPFGTISFVPNRIVRDFVARFGPTRLRYRRLTPNYEKYWVRDSDAVNSIDSHKAMLWFRSRGDECLSCQGQDASVFVGSIPLIIRVHKTVR